MGFEVETLKFEGPLDLMLHLIHEQQLDIFDLDMSALTDQYINYLHQMEELHLEVESEYLVELSTLIEYKSKKLLPKKADEPDDDFEDPKDKLVRRLLEYQKYKEVTKTLYDSFVERQDQLAKPVSFDEIVKMNNDEEQKIEGDPYDLLKAMNKVLRRLQLSRPLDIKFTQKELSPEDRILEIKARLKDLPETFSFDTLIEDCDNIHEYVITFIAILDMAKDHYLTFAIDDNDNIWFSRGTNND
ncbi:MAG: segregation/condensation protein A [Erysipelotrichaceae bacterium]|nr:segregation/condensation protein A [Erysipelotrichaceae bacterium]MBR0419078.1 segregation/condensation protein A [Erysipelotrichaceae bacterium]